MLPSISHISIKNFKNLREVELDLKPLNILIGQNGAGKSNFLNIFNLLSAGANEKLANTIRDQGGIEALIWRENEKFESSFSITLTFSSLQQVNPRYQTETSYRLQLSRQGNSYVASSEEITQPDSSNISRPYDYLVAKEGNIRFLRSLNYDYEDDVKEYNPQELIISQLRDKRRYPVLDELRSLIGNWIIFRGFGENAIANIHKPQPLEAIIPLRLDPGGEQLVSVLHTLSNNARYDRANDHLQEVLKAAFPDFKKLDFKQQVGSPLTALHWRTQNGVDFPTYSLSDGILRFLGLATLLLLPEPPSLITIDEPEIGLHPKLIPLLLDLFKSAATRTQLIVTTHSPLLLDEDYIELDDIILVERDADGATRLDRAGSLNHLKDWLQDFTLGNLWTMGKLKLVE